MPKRLRLEELIGKRFDRLVITGLGKIKGKAQYYTVLCDCGNTKECQLGHLEHGNILSCGCKRIEKVLAKNKLHPANYKHGLNKHPLFKIWNNMMSRCYRKKDINYNNYGGNGVIVCEEWQKSCLAFYHWGINNGWLKGLELDKDKLSPSKTGKIYSPEYCCFLTKKENMQYRSTTVIIKYKNKKQSLSQWADELGFDFQLLCNRHTKGWAVERMFETPVRTSKLVKFNGEEKSLPDWCVHLGLPYQTVMARINKLGWTHEKAFSTPTGLYHNHKQKQSA